MGELVDHPAQQHGRTRFDLKLHVGLVAEDAVQLSFKVGWHCRPVKSISLLIQPRNTVRPQGDGAPLEAVGLQHSIPVGKYYRP